MMLLKVWSVAAALLLVGLAGCADDKTSSDGGDEFDDSFDDLDDGSVSSGKGLIRGVVVDQTITPIEGATVKVLNSELEATTNENGAFVFKDLDPGSYFLEATKLGFAKVQTSTEVEADEEKPPVLKMVLTAEPGTAPYHTPYQWSGFLGCSVRAVARGLSCPGADVVWPRHDFLVDYELDKVPDWIVSEMTWKSTQTFGGEMSFNLRRDDTNTDTTDVEGTSPLFLTLNKDEAGADGIGADSPLRVIIFTAHLKETEPPAGGLWGIGLQLEQEFDTFTHVFYNYVPPEDWRFIEDQRVPKPQ